MLIDTNVLIDFTRGRREARTFLRSLDQAPYASVLTVAELYTGIREGGERRLLEHLLSDMTIVVLDLKTAEIGGLFHRGYRRSHGVDLVDALIAATAERHGLRLATRNARHFPMLADVLVPC